MMNKPYQLWVYRSDVRWPIAVNRLSDGYLIRFFAWTLIVSLAKRG
jgi:hypothetical protein